ncbi:MAG: potassium channel family protein [Deltaproteobacteria bacterium]|nr:TrkA family potassium uptake protein [Candidatus Deferrimicrobiaceae bacterium]
MKILIIGCGRLGAGLAKTLELRRHAVTVVDRDPAVFGSLGAFKGQTVEGSGIDREALLRAGIERADGLAAVTASDEINVVAGRLAVQVFRVPRVVARLYDPLKAEIYRRLGLQTITPVAWGINRLAELLCHSRLDTIHSLGSGEVDLVEAEAPPLLVGRTTGEVTVPGEIHVVAVSRGGRTFLPAPGAVFHKGDLVHLAVLGTSADRLKAILGLS